MLRPGTRESTGAKTQKRIATTLGTALVAGTVGVVAGAQSASAAPVTYNVHCVPPSIGGDPFDFDAQVELTVEPAKPSYSVGDEVTVTWAWKSAATNPSSVTVNADSVKPRGTVTVSGAQGGEIAMEGPQKNEKTPSGEKLWLAPMTGRLKIDKPGKLTLAPGAYTSTANMFGSWDTPCTPNGVPPVGAELSVDGQVQPASLALPRTHMRPGSTVQVTGANWPSGGEPPVAELCAEDGGSCDPGKASGSTLTVDASGNLTGLLRLAGDIPDGVYRLKVHSAGASVDTVLVVSASAPPFEEAVTYGVRYTPPPANGPSFVWEPQVTLSVSPQKPYYEIGEEVTVKWHWNQPPRNPSSWVIAIKDTVTPSGVVSLSGAQTGEVKVSGPKGNRLTGGGKPLEGLNDMTGTFKVEKAGRIDLAPGGYGLKVLLQSSSGVPTGKPAVSTAIQAGVPATPEMSVTPGSLKPGERLTVGGRNWPTGQGDPRIELCSADGSDCSAEAFTGATGKVAADGTLTGEAVLAAGVPAGDRSVRVTVGDVSVTAALRVTAEAGTTPTVTMDPTHGPVGTVVTARGADFTPGAKVLVEGLKGDGPTGDSVEATAGEDGAFTAQLTVNDKDTNALRVTEVGKGVVSTVPYTVEGGNGGEPPVGSLSMTQAGTGITLSDIPFSSTDQAMTGKLNTVTVTDTRNGNLGWELSGAVSDFTSAEGARIPAGNLSWTPKCASTGPAGQVVNGSPGAVNGGLLCSVATSAEGTTSGTFTADADVSLNVPGFQAPGTYTGTLTLTIS